MNSDPLHGTPVITRSPDETQELAARLVETLPSRAVLALAGDLGSGKTCFAQGIATALGIEQAITSPTFTVINEYMGSRSFFHMDLYRLSGPDELLALGFEDYLDIDGVVAVEWPDRAENMLPPDTITITFETLDEPDQRRITIHTTG